ncbi:hypothetical protein ACF3DV_26540 [Chlorogloeopsis fritschii PCC 9212]|uniref:Uncharacterized protein n=1 Tax=Chlorogloeopsis fritschii PCC 6912 TaxID=211165 RepID=A0A433N3Y5_CHLFR|nr:hypothetical protein [Chlorogloeopsis fritschii]RUR75967.1 hypothetical protein PCC6912_45390 [Chlorogloeopsis fritschii PCC 6912]
MIQNSDNLELTWEEQGNYAFPYEGVQLHLHGMAAEQAWVDGTEVNYQGKVLECNRFQQVRFRLFETNQ